MRILIVEDDSVLTGLYKDWLLDILKSFPGTIVNIISNGKKADVDLQSSVYDATILDMALPGESGDSLYKKHSKNMGTVVLASTFSDFFKHILNRDDCCFILNKPFEKSDLENTIKRIMEVSHVDKGTDCDRAEYSVI